MTCRVLYLSYCTPPNMPNLPIWLANLLRNLKSKKVKTTEKQELFIPLKGNSLCLLQPADPETMASKAELCRNAVCVNVFP